MSGGGRLLKRDATAIVFVGVIVFVGMMLPSDAAYARDILYNESILSETAPRTEGSANEENAINAIVSELERMGVAYRTGTFLHYTEYFSRSKNIYAFVEGEIDRTVVLAAGLNRASSYSLSLLLSILERYRLSPPETNVVFAFLGADYLHDEYIGIGSRLLIESLGSTVIESLLYVNLDHPPETMEIDIGTTDQTARRDTTELMIRAAKEAGQKIDIPAFWRTTANGRVNFLRAHGEVNASPTDFFLRRNIPALTLSVAESPRVPQLYTAVDSIERMVSLVSHTSVAPEKNYLLVPVGAAFHVIGEASIVYTLVALVALILCAGYFSKGSLRKQYVPLMKRHLLLFISHIAALFTALYTSRFFIETLFSFFPIVDIWTYFSFVTVVLKLAIALLLYALFSIAIARIHATPVSKTYSAFALTLGGASSVVAVVDLFLAITTAWLFLSTLCFVLAKKPKQKAVVLGIALLAPIGYLTPYLVWAPSELHRTIVFSNAVHSFVLTMITLPYFFMYLRLRTLGVRMVKGAVGCAVVALYAVLVTVLFAVYDPFIAVVPNDIRIIETVDQNNRTHLLRYYSNIGKKTGVTVDVDIQQSITPTTTEQILEIAYKPYYEVEHTMRTTGAYHVHRLVVSGEGGARGVREMEIVLTSLQEVTIVDASIPYQHRENNTVQFYSGRSLPLPVVVEFTVPESSSYPFTVEMTVTPRTLLVGAEVQVESNAKRERPYTLRTDGTVVLRYNITNDRG